MAKLFTNSFVRPVYYEMGQVDGQQTYRRAPFDLLFINGQMHIQPRSIMSSELALTALATVFDDELKSWREGDFGRETLQPIIIGEHEMGDGSDTWKGLHSISNL